MKSVNKAILLGNVGKDPEMRSTGSGTMVANMSIACAERYKDNTGNWADRTEWVNLVAFGRTAEVVRDYVHKGSRIHVIGKLQTNSWDDRKTGEKKYKTQVVIDDLVLLDGRDKESGAQQEHAPQGQSTRQNEPIDDDDIPF